MKDEGGEWAERHGVQEELGTNVRCGGDLSML